MRRAIPFNVHLLLQHQTGEDEEVALKPSATGPENPRQNVQPGSPPTSETPTSDGPTSETDNPVNLTLNLVRAANSYLNISYTVTVYPTDEMTTAAGDGAVVTAPAGYNYGPYYDVQNGTLNWQNIHPNSTIVITDIKYGTRAKMEPWAGTISQRRRATFTIGICSESTDGSGDNSRVQTLTDSGIYTEELIKYQSFSPLTLAPGDNVCTLTVDAHRDPNPPRDDDR